QPEKASTASGSWRVGLVSHSNVLIDSNLLPGSGYRHSSMTGSGHRNRSYSYAMTWWVVTGGIGSGQSTVTRLASAAGYSKIDADIDGHDDLAGPPKATVAARWPEVIEDDYVNHKIRGAIVFADRAQLEELEAITHPLITEEL